MTRFLVVFDVDSTLIKDEVIELLAESAGKKAEVAAITEAAMRGELDFASSLHERVATLRNLPESVLIEAYSKVRITDGVRELIDAVHSAGGKVGAVSGGFAQILEPLAEQLNLDFYRANLLEVVDGHLTGKVIGPVIDRRAKAQALMEWCSQLGLKVIHSLAVGDGANDLDMMKLSGLSVAFNAKPQVRQSADLVVAGDSLSALIPVIGVTNTTK